MAKQRGTGKQPAERDGHGVTSPDGDAAPSITDSKRLTFLLRLDAFNGLRLHSGHGRARNSAAGLAGDEAFPETPSAVVREAIRFWLDQFADARDQSRTTEEWKARIEELRRFMET